MTYSLIHWRTSSISDGTYAVLPPAPKREQWEGGNMGSSGRMWEWTRETGSIVELVRSHFTFRLSPSDSSYGEPSLFRHYREEADHWHHSHRQRQRLAYLDIPSLMAFSRTEIHGWGTRPRGTWGARTSIYCPFAFYVSIVLECYFYCTYVHLFLLPFISNIYKPRGASLYSSNDRLR